MHRKPSRLAAARARWAERLARSSRVFLLGLVIACGIEVVVDWNQTFYEINVLRLATWARGRSSALAGNDIAVVTVEREHAD